MTSVVIEVELQDGDYMDVTFYGDCYWDDVDYSDYRPVTKTPSIFGDVEWEKFLYSDDENRQIEEFLNREKHVVEHKLLRTFEDYDYD